MFKFIAMFFAFLAAASFANAQEYYDLALVRADGMKIVLKHLTNNRAGQAFYLYNEPGYSNSNTKLQDMDAASVILGLGSPNNITDDNRSRIMQDPNTGRNYKVSLPTLGEIRNLRNVHGGRPSNWRGNLDNHYEFWTSTKTTSGMHKTLDIDNGQHNDRWDWGMRVLALTVQEEVSDNRVCFYEHTNYEGKSKCFTNGNYTDLGNYPSEGGSAVNTFSSVKLGASCTRVSIKESAYTPAATYSENTTQFFYQGYNDRTGIVNVTCTQDLATQDPYSVCFFEHPNYRGRSKCFTNGSYPTVGNYPDGTNANDTFSSYSIGAGCKGYGRIIFYTGENYTGSDAETAVGNASATDPIRRQPVLDQYWNDRFSSIVFNCLRP
ncbi:hypothetical protein [Limnohabitans sp.]|uniref:hypothetical protein n=1 Tax=Limnohabitans sp. TaxID=1907725 RepID=UPI00286F18EB|nr:hypothetical protein [Limnohabitans sp.]